MNEDKLKHSLFLVACWEASEAQQRNLENPPNLGEFQNLPKALRDAKHIDLARKIRAAEYHVADAPYNCPICWVRQGSHIPLMSIDADDEGRHRLLCSNCEATFVQ